MMPCVLLETVQGLQCTMSLLSYAAPLDDETLAQSGRKSKRLMFSKEIIRIYVHCILGGIHNILSPVGMLWISEKN